ncbi:MAG: phytanoyl-CoA dioxygenase family protein, partial [Bacteroidetes bacterium]|nr:phytanoyl-CoA dioxygenase family protein [Bacteroidota bacterium]
MKTSGAPSLPVAYEEERAKFESHLITLPLKSGEAFVFNQKLMHASWPNKSMENRLALTIGFSFKPQIYLCYI